MNWTYLLVGPFRNNWPVPYLSQTIYSHNLECVSLNGHFPSILFTETDPCLTFILRQPMARIAAASEACGSVRFTVYTNRGEAATSHLGLPLPQVYSRLQNCNALSPHWMDSQLLIQHHLPAVHFKRLIQSHFFSQSAIFVVIRSIALNFKSL